MTISKKRRMIKRLGKIEMLNEYCNSTQLCHLCPLTPCKAFEYCTDKELNKKIKAFEKHYKIKRRTKK
jgi:hypothetical protein